LESFKNNIKEEVLLLGGTTYEAYYRRRPINVDGYDPVDGVIFQAARYLERRYLRVFGPLYECHSREQTCDRLEQRGHNRISLATLDRYRAYIENRIVEIIRNSPELMKALKAAIEK